MIDSSMFFANYSCEYFPCHELKGDFNCLFCYCPMYAYDDCPGNKTYIENNGCRIKVCTDCTFPHKPENYEKIIRFLTYKMNNKKTATAGSR